MPFFSVAVTHSPVARRSAAGAALRGEGSEQMWPLQQCFLVCSIVQRLWHMGTFTAPALLPRTEDAGSGVLWLCFHQLAFSRQFAVPARKDADPSLPSPWPPTPRVCDWQGRGNQTVVIPALFDYLSLRSNAQPLQGTKNPIAACCPQLEAHPKHLVQL